MTASPTDDRLAEILEHVPNCRYGCIACEAVPGLVAEIQRLRALVNPATWTAPDGTVLDLSRQVFDRDGDAWTLSVVPPLTMAMVDGDLAERPLSLLFERLGPLTNEGEEL